MTKYLKNQLNSAYPVNLFCSLFWRSYSSRSRHFSSTSLGDNVVYASIVLPVNWFVSGNVLESICWRFERPWTKEQKHRTMVGLTTTVAAAWRNGDVRRGSVAKEISPRVFSLNGILLAQAQHVRRSRQSHRNFHYVGGLEYKENTVFGCSRRLCLVFHQLQRSEMARKSFSFARFSRVNDDDLDDQWKTKFGKNT